MAQVSLLLEGFVWRAAGTGSYMGLFEFLRLLLVGDDQSTLQPSMAQITIISTATAKRSSGSR